MWLKSPTKVVHKVNVITWKIVGSFFYLNLFLDPNDGGQALDLEETAAELRRENFRLRLMLYNYERMYRYANTSQDLESSRVYAAESQNVLLKESLNEKQVLLDSASKMIDILKEENNQLHEQIDDLKRKHHGTENDWRNKYDNLHSELQCTQEKVHALEMCVLAKETEFAKCKNEFQSSIARLQAELAFSQHNSKRYRRELQMFRTEADDLRATLENVNKSHLHKVCSSIPPHTTVEGYSASATFLT
ncbi:unnamed protein product [Heterobilharzia americana]|nr:unnamed protein product [Heterobilharzia americana]